jgi:tRNA(adenine34) deaminase
MTTSTTDTRWDEPMGLAIRQALMAPHHEDVPIGAVILNAEGNVVAADHNRREERSDPTAHAEILVLREAARLKGSWRLEDYTLVVTLEPCVMCAGAAVASRLGRIVYGAADLKSGAVWSLYNIAQDARLNHRSHVVAGVMESRCAAILTAFFAERRD